MVLRDGVSASMLPLQLLEQERSPHSLEVVLVLGSRTSLLVADPSQHPFQCLGLDCPRIKCVVIDLDKLFQLVVVAVEASQGAPENLSKSIRKKGALKALYSFRVKPRRAPTPPFLAYLRNFLR